MGGRKQNAALYKVMLFTRRNGVYKEYMPLKIGFGKTELVDGRIMRLGKELKPVKAGYNAAADRKTTLGAESPEGQGKEHHLPGLSAARMVLRVVRLSGPLRHRPGQHQRLGAERRPHRRRHAVERPSACRRLPRTREGDVLPFAQFHLRHRLLLGGPSGNGYNMYKAYQWLKSVEKSRPVIYSDTDGEWNSDL